jgi:hypothetical protein
MPKFSSKCFRLGVFLHLEGHNWKAMFYLESNIIICENIITTANKFTRANVQVSELVNLSCSRIILVYFVEKI